MTPSQPTGTTRLRVLATSDLHMHLKSFDYFGNALTPGLGLECLVDTIEDLRRTAQGAAQPHQTLLLDNGDLLQGTALGDHLGQQTARDNPHPVASLLNRLGYDAVGLGNHDLDYGIDYLDWFARDLKAPLVSSNFKVDTDRNWPSPLAILSLQDLRVGIVSVLPERTQIGLHALIGDIARIENMIASCAQAASQARAQGADLVIALAHTGIGSDNMENALDLIARDAGVDALVGGHTHLVFPGQDHADHTGADMDTGLLHGVPTVMPGFGGALVGCIDLDLARDSAGAWQITKGSGSVFPARQTATRTKSALKPIEAAHAQTCRALDREMARTEVAVTSYFSLVTPTREQSLLATAQAMAIDTARQGTACADLPLLSAVSSPRVGGRGGPWNYTDIPAGPMKARQVAELHIYSNLIWAVHVTGADLREWLEKSASVFARQDEAVVKALVDPRVPSFDFDVIFGVTYRIDPLQPARYTPSGQLCDPKAQRIYDLSYKSQPVKDDDAFLVAVNSFRACGGGNFPGLEPDRPVLRPQLTSAQVIQTFLASDKPSDQTAPWSFAQAARGLSTWIDTGPGAMRHIADIAHLRPGTPQLTQTGFLRIPITL